MYLTLYKIFIGEAFSWYSVNEMKQNTLSCHPRGVRTGFWCVKWSGCQCVRAPLINIFLQPALSVRHYRAPRADHLDLHLGVAGGGRWVEVGATTGVHWKVFYVCVSAGGGVRSVPNTAEMDGGQWRSRAWWWRIWQAWLHSVCLGHQGQNQTHSRRFTRISSKNLTFSCSLIEWMIH